MLYAYVIKSINHDYYYKGHCHNLQKRLEQHNAGMTKSISPFAPFQLVYFEEFNCETGAISRENILKRQLADVF